MILASFFYEWQQVGGAKVPHAIKRVAGAPTSFAGLTSVWTDRETGAVIAAAIVIRTTPNEAMARLYNRMLVRMPVILPEHAIAE
jgi:putative SOS response-associated peptidase YedK